MSNQGNTSKSSMKLQKSFWTSFMLGGLSGTISKTIVAPLERVKILLQLQENIAAEALAVKYTGMGDCFRRVYAE